MPVVSSQKTELVPAQVQAHADALSTAGFGELSVQQRLAMEALLQGKTMRESASVAGVGKSTVHRWLREDARFTSLYHQWRQELNESCLGRLTTIAERATDAIEVAIDKGDPRTALALLKGLGILRPRPFEPTNPDQLRQKMELDSRQRQLELDKRSAKLQIEADLSNLGLDAI